MSINQITPSKQCVLVNEINLPSGIIYKNQKYLNDVRFWHKFIVSNTDNVSRNDVLQTILDHVHPLDLIPVYYAKDNFSSNSYFMARNCGAAIEKLCKDNLVINHPFNKDNTQFHRPFKISILLNFSTTDQVKIDVQKNVLSVLQSRHNSDKQILNLKKFGEDPELTEYCPLSQPKIMYFVLHLAKNLNVKKLILAENNIKIITPLEVVIGSKVCDIDLSNNQIASIEDLAILKKIKPLNELSLTGNPLCSNVEEIDYIKSIVDMCPSLTVLDGVVLKQSGFPVTKRNFLCDPAGFDLVNQFVEFYFTIYDKKSKERLESLYHNNALFSLTTTYHEQQASSTTAFLKLYHSFSRNLYKSADVSKNYECLFRSKTKIVELLLKLPHTEHDPYSFNVDLVYKQPTCAIIVVNGVFKEPPQSLLARDQMYGFTRTFALEISNGKECVIVNEQLHIYNALTQQQVPAFSVSRPVKSRKPSAIKPKDRQEAVRTIKAITNLKLEWARKCLEECNYDLKSALDLFVNLYKNDKFPDEAFVGDNYEKEMYGRFMCDADGNLIAEEPTELVIKWNIPSTDLEFENLNAELGSPVRYEYRDKTSPPKVPEAFKLIVRSHILAKNQNFRKS